jgi:hypothetical protein
MWTGLVVSPNRNRIFNLDLLDFKYHFTAFQKPCMLSGFPSYSNSTSNFSRSFCTASGFCPSQSTTLRSKISGTKPLTTSSQAFFPRHVPSISHPGCIVICLGFRPEEILLAAMSSFSFLFCRLAALVALLVFPVLLGGGSSCVFGGHKGPRYGINPRADGIIQGTCDGTDYAPACIIHGTCVD